VQLGIDEDKANFASLEPWGLSFVDVVGALGSNSDSGLTAEEVASRLQRFGYNELQAERAVPRWRKFLGQFNDPLIYLLLAAVLVSFVAWILEGSEGIPYEVIVILSIVIVNAILGFVQEARAERAVARYKR
jgi:P-type Ca2+ transporter type 2C